jgi:hypothetical protein
MPPRLPKSATTRKRGRPAVLAGSVVRPVSVMASFQVLAALALLPLFLVSLLSALAVVVFFKEVGRP